MMIMFIVNLPSYLECGIVEVDGDDDHDVDHDDHHDVDYVVVDDGGDYDDDNAVMSPSPHDLIRGEAPGFENRETCLFRRISAAATTAATALASARESLMELLNDRHPVHRRRKQNTPEKKC